MTNNRITWYSVRKNGRYVTPDKRWTDDVLKSDQIPLVDAKAVAEDIGGDIVSVYVTVAPYCAAP